MRGVAVAGGVRWSETMPALPPVQDASPDTFAVDLPVSAGLAHVYTECARIWNPIHTDRKVALAAGLPDIILHGTATLALAVSALVRHRLGNDPLRVKRVACRFAAMVPMPTVLSLRVTRRSPAGLWFQVLARTGDLAIRDGFLGLA